jgi:hypothetical protein
MYGRGKRTLSRVHCRAIGIPRAAVDTCVAAHCGINAAEDISHFVVARMLKMGEQKVQRRAWLVSGDGCLQ